MLLRTCFALLLFGCCFPAVAARLPMHELAKRLIDSPNQKAAWAFEQLSEPLGGDASDCELLLQHPSLPLQVAIAGPILKVRTVTAVIGPIDPTTTQGKQAISAGREALAAVAAIPSERVRRWMVENRGPLLEGSPAKPESREGDHLFGNSYDGKKGLTLYLSYLWEEEKEAAPKKGLSSLEHFAKTAANWSVDGARSYRHATGVLLTAVDGADPRIVVEYDGKDEKQSAMASAFWLLIPGISGDDEYDTNRLRVAEWLKAPKPDLQLIGASVAVDIKGDGKALLTIRVE